MSAGKLRECRTLFTAALKCRLQGRALYNRSDSALLLKGTHFTEQCPATVGNVTAIPKRMYNRGLPPPKPLPFDYSGDPYLTELDVKEPRLEFENSTELSDADESVKRILSLEFGTKADMRNKILDRVLSKVQEHPADIESLEVKITDNTVMIRNLLQHCTKFRKDKVAKVQLLERIQARQRDCKYLRLKDIKKFDWLMKELKIKYVPPQDLELDEARKHINPSKRTARANAAEKFYKDDRTQKMEELRTKLAAERKEFEEFKKQELNQIETELRKMNINTDVGDMEDLFRQMGLGPPYVMPPQRKVSRRSETLARKFEKYCKEKGRNVKRN